MDARALNSIILVVLGFMGGNNTQIWPSHTFDINGDPQQTMLSSEAVSVYAVNQLMWKGNRSVNGLFRDMSGDRFGFHDVPRSTVVAIQTGINVSSASCNEAVWKDIALTMLASKHVDVYAHTFRHFVIPYEAGGGSCQWMCKGFLQCKPTNCASFSRVLTVSDVAQSIALNLGIYDSIMDGGTTASTIVVDYSCLMGAVRASSSELRLLNTMHRYLLGWLDPLAVSDVEDSARLVTTTTLYSSSTSLLPTCQGADGAAIHCKTLYRIQRQNTTYFVSLRTALPAGDTASYDAGLAPSLQNQVFIHRHEILFGFAHRSVLLSQMHSGGQFLDASTGAHFFVQDIDVRAGVANVNFYGDDRDCAGNFPAFVADDSVRVIAVPTCGAPFQSLLAFTAVTPNASHCGTDAQTKVVARAPKATFSLPHGWLLHGCASAFVRSGGPWTLAFDGQEGRLLGQGNGSDHTTRVQVCGALGAEMIFTAQLQGGQETFVHLEADVVFSSTHVVGTLRGNVSLVFPLDALLLSNVSLSGSSALPASFHIPVQLINRFLQRGISALVTIFVTCDNLQTPPPTSTTSHSVSRTALSSYSVSLTPSVSISATSTFTRSSTATVTARSLSCTTSASISPSRSATTSRSPSRSATTSRSPSRSASKSRSPSRTGTTSRLPSRSATTSRSPSRSLELA